MNNSIEIVNKIDKSMRRYDFESKMDTIRMLSHSVDKFLPNKKMLDDVFVDSNKKQVEEFKKNVNKYLYPHELEYLSLISCVKGEWDGPLKKFNTYDDFRKVTNIYKSYSYPVVDNKKQITYFDTLIMISKLMMQQRGWQEHFFIKINKFGKLFHIKNQYIDMEKLFIEKYSYDSDTYFKLVWVIFNASYSTKGRFIMKSASEFLLKCGFTKKQLVKMLLILGANREQLIKEYKEHKCDDISMRIYDYNPLKKYPLIFYNSYWYLPFPAYLFDAVTEGLFYRLIDDKGLSFKDKFGKYVFEKYVEDILKIRKNDYKIIPEFNYGKDKKFADFTLINNNEVILVEVKSCMATLKLKYGNEKEFINEIVKTYKTALLQCTKKEIDLRKGKVNHNDIPKNIDKIMYLIITMSEYPFTTNEEIRKIICDSIDKDDKIKSPQKKEILEVLKSKKFHFIDIDSLEKLLEVDKKTLFDFLKLREEDKKLRWGDYISTQITNEYKNKDREFFKYATTKIDNLMKNYDKNLNIEI